MKNSKICNNCGYDNSYTSSSIYCVKCGNKLDGLENTEENVIQNTDEQSEDLNKKRGRWLTTILMILFLSSIVFCFVGLFDISLIILALVMPPLLIFGICRYFKNKKLLSEMIAFFYGGLFIASIALMRTLFYVVYLSIR